MLHVIYVNVCSKTIKIVTKKKLFHFSVCLSQMKVLRSHDMAVYTTEVICIMTLKVPTITAAETILRYGYLLIFPREIKLNNSYKSSA